MADPSPPWLVIPPTADVYRRLDALARGARRVFFAGLPGTGKSLFIHQLAHLAHALGRRVHLLQWDTARPVFEASPAGRRYPVVDGVTHVAIRKAVGLWVRAAVLAWDRDHAAPESLLIGETPLVGNRFVELAQPHQDAAEPVLTAPATRFVIPVPSREVRRLVAEERARRAAAPVHDHEREDAPPQVLRELWRELVAVAVSLGLGDTGADAGYDPELYRRVYERLLRHRHVDVLSVEIGFPTAALSVYDFAIARRDVRPTPAEAGAAIRDVERRYPAPAALRRAVERWYRY